MNASNVVGRKFVSTDVSKSRVRSVVGLKFVRTVGVAVHAGNAAVQLSASMVASVTGAGTAGEPRSAITAAAGLSAKNVVELKYVSTPVGKRIAGNAVAQRSAHTIVLHIDAETAAGHKFVAIIVFGRTAKFAAKLKYCQAQAC